MEQKNEQFLRGIHDSVPVALGYLAVSFTLGIAARKSGITPLQAMVASLLNNTSAGEFAAFSLIGAGVSYLETALTTFILNVRYILMSCALSQKLVPNAPIQHRFLIAYDVTDEIFGLGIMSNGCLDPQYMYGIIALASPAWAIGTYLGALTGGIMPVSVLSAMNVALYGMFIAVIVPPAKKDKIIGAIIAVSMVSSFLFSHLPGLRNISSGVAIIILTLVISLAAAGLFPVGERKEAVGCDA
ncbi:inner membrane protein YgaZ [Clostridiales bacterium]|nr:inner membrane protein YgaZ [Clostridiales bacterium]